jgi:hypothetical protein
MKHYMCYEVHMTSINITRIVDTLTLFPQHVKIPHHSTSELALKSARELTYSLKNLPPAAPFAHVGDEQKAALVQLAKNFPAPHEEEVAPPRAQLQSIYLQLNTPPINSKGGCRISKGGSSMSKGAVSVSQYFSNASGYKLSSQAPSRA